VGGFSGSHELSARIFVAVIPGYDRLEIIAGVAYGLENELFSWLLCGSSFSLVS
jgi:hypothetical protein